MDSSSSLSLLERASSSLSLSGPIKALVDDPLDFLKKNAILGFVLINLPQEYISDDGATFRSGTAVVKLVQTQTANHYKLQFVANKDFDTKEDVAAFVLGFKENKTNDDAPYVDIPRKNAPYLEGKFMFTVGLTGCSVIVTRLTDVTFRVFHDRRMDSAVLYDNVEMCVDFNDYRIGGRYLSSTGNAFTCMQFKSAAWKMFVQLQPPGEGDKPEWETIVAEQDRDLSPASLEKVFNDRRVILQNRVKSNAGKLKVDVTLINSAKDGVVRGVVYDEDAIRSWNALRDASKRQIQIDREKGIPPSLKDTYDRFEDALRDSKQMDETWIWLQIKKNKAEVQH